jgi:hypothetical protein
MTTNAAPINARALVGTHDILFVTLDTLRYDVAMETLRAGRTPNLQRYLPDGTWEKRHTPATFTYAAHQAFFAGFLPTPVTPGPHPRLFAARFPGSESTADGTCVFDTPDIVSGLAARGYHTVCIGGVGFFNKASPLGHVLPSLFAESHWDTSIGVASPTSTERQVAVAQDCLASLAPDKRAFVFINVSALHQPNRFYLEGATHDTRESMAAALVYVDHHLPRLIASMAQRAPLLTILCSDHGTAYGDDGFHGHRLAHPSVWDVPYAEFVLDREVRS